MFKPNLPQLGTAVFGWEQRLLIGIVGKFQEDYLTKEAVVYKKFRAVKQPLAVRQLELKPEGERAWAWYWLHAESALQLTLDDEVIFDDGNRYRVMGRKDYSDYGYMEYELVKGYELA